MDKNSESDLAYLGRRIRKLREMNDFSQEFIANELNMSISGYSRIERDEVKLTLDKLIIICRLLDISIEDLLNTDDRKLIEQVKYQQKSNFSDDVKSFSKNSVEDVYREQIRLLKDEIRYLRDIINKLTK
jgi:transcriptional regulator with XRE-family HTH domain